MDIKKIIIVGTGISAWAAANLLHKQLPAELVEVEVIEGILGDSIPAESSRAQLLNFHELIGLSEKKVVSETTAGFSLGIEFKKWSDAGQSCFVAEGIYGSAYRDVDFQSLYVKSRYLGNEASFDHYSINAAAGSIGRFGHPAPDPKSIYSLIKYGLNLSTVDYVEVLKKHAIEAGVKFTQGGCKGVQLSPETGCIQSITLDNGDCKPADFFIDCTGADSVLLGRGLGTEDKVHTISTIYDRIIFGERAITSSAKPAASLRLEDGSCIKSMTTETQEFIFYYFSSNYMSESAAKSKLKNLGISTLQIKDFQWQRKAQFWVKNCLAVGEAVMIVPDIVISPYHLMRNLLVRFIDFMGSFNNDISMSNEFNRLSAIEYDRLIELNELAFYLGRSQSNSVQNYFLNNELCETTKHKLALFSSMARHATAELDLLTHTEWTALLTGNGIIPKAYDMKADLIEEKDLLQFLNKINVATSEYAKRMPLHSNYIAQKLR